MLLFQLVDEPPAQARAYRFESVEVKETAFRIDGVLLPPDEASPKTVFFVEVQFQKDESLYHRFFTELFLYLYRSPGSYDDWCGVVLFPSRQLEPSDITMHRSLLTSAQVTRIYLDELGDPQQQPIGVHLMQLTIASEAEMATQAKQLLERIEQETLEPSERQTLIDITTTIVVYKFSSLSRAEVEAMLGVHLEETRVYQEAKAEGRVEGELVGQLKMVPLLLEMGMTVEQIAERIGVDVSVVRQAAQSQTQE
jgi:predicted transposase/invertase (TIGR01784 family)